MPLLKVSRCKINWETSLTFGCNILDSCSIITVHAIAISQSQTQFSIHFGLFFGLFLCYRHHLCGFFPLLLLNPEDKLISWTNHRQNKETSKICWCPISMKEFEGPEFGDSTMSHHHNIMFFCSSAIWIYVYDMSLGTSRDLYFSWNMALIRFSTVP